MYGDWAVRHGAIGQYETQKGNFAIFPTEEDGIRAHRELLARDNYQKLTLNGLVEKYAPPEANDTVKYQQFVSNRLGLPGDTPLHSLTAAQMDRLVNALRTFEGWRPRNRLHVGGSGE